ncbi:MAG: DsbA family protein [Burkholderiales bacterium]|nr:DsbA family protein [Burkholderiales bacterium]
MTTAEALEPLRFYHRPDDPWSHLLAQCLPALLEVYRLRLECITLPFPDLEHAPRPEMLARHALRDARDLAQYHVLSFPQRAVLPPAELALLASRALLAPQSSADYLRRALALGDALFTGDAPRVHALTAADAMPDEAAAHRLLEANHRELLDTGHYHSGMVAFRGMWYWGIDRLAHLEHDLLMAGLRRPERSVGVLRRRPAAEWPAPPLHANGGAPVELDWFCSFRSPYAYVSAARTLALAARYPVTIRPKLIIPMKMAGFVIPDRKRDYFRMDAAREALRHGVPFGNFCDPFGPGLERAMAAADVAQRAGRLVPYLLSVMQGVWADGIDTASDEGMRRLSERAELDWRDVWPVLGSQSWRDWADRHREELAALGQYAAPTYRLGDWVTWGQDRLWMVEQKLRAALGLAADRVDTPAWTSSP